MVNEKFGFYTSGMKAKEEFQSFLKDNSRSRTASPRIRTFQEIRKFIIYQYTELEK